jgi:hypothetical protein
MNNKSRQFSGFDAIQPALNEMGQMARDSNDESKNPWAGVRYQSGVPIFHKVYRGITTGYFDEDEKPAKPAKIDKKNLGIHWSSDPDVARGFAENDSLFSDNVEDMSSSGSTFHALIHDKDIEDINDPEVAKRLWTEHGVYGPDDQEHEEEVTAKKGSPVLVQHVEGFKYPNLTDSGTFKSKDITPPKVFRT